MRYRDAFCPVHKSTILLSSTKRCHFNDLGMYVNRRYSFWKALAFCHFFFSLFSAYHLISPMYTSYAPLRL